MNLALLNLELRPHRLIMKFNALMMQILTNALTSVGRCISTQYLQDCLSRVGCKNPVPGFQRYLTVFTFSSVSTNSLRKKKANMAKKLLVSLKNLLQPNTSQWSQTDHTLNSDLSSNSANECKGAALFGQLGAKLKQRVTSR